MSRAVVAAEKAGIPAVGIVVDDFMKSAQATARAAGLREARLASYPGAIAIHPTGLLEQNLRETVFPRILELLAQSPAKAASGERPGMDADIVCEGTFEEINAQFLARGWTDGLPIIPPTPESVARFVGCSGKAADDILAVLHPSLARASVRSLAVNAVMAGCKPDLMPVLMALVAILANRRFHQEDIGSTAGWTPLILLNGPVIERLGFNASTAAMRHGNQSNSTVSRALRLFLRNVAGFVPGVGDMATFGRPDMPVLAENEKLSPWEPLSVARGFAPGESVVTMTSLGAMSFHLTVVATGAEQILRNIARKVQLMLLSGDGSVITKGLEVSHVLALSPVIAHTIAAAGYGRKDVQQFIYEYSKVTAREFDEWLALQGIPSAAQCVERGLLQPHFAQSEDPERLVPLYHFPEELQIIVSGTENRNRFFLVMNIARQGLATSAPIDLSPLDEGPRPGAGG